jgi:hypothetical protein
VEGDWPGDAFPGAGPAIEPDESRARLWDELWDAHESARRRLKPGRR